MHGGQNENVPAEYNMTHGGAAQFIRRSDLPGILERMRELDSKEGKAEAIKRRYAITEQLADSIRINLESESGATGIDHALGAEDRLVKQIGLLHEIEAEQQAQLPTTFVIGNFDPNQNAPFQSRSLDGACTVRYLEGQPFMLDVPTGCWCPAIEQTDEESGAKFFTRLLNA